MLFVHKFCVHELFTFNAKQATSDIATDFKLLYCQWVHMIPFLILFPRRLYYYTICRVCVCVCGGRVAQLPTNSVLHERVCNCKIPLYSSHQSWSDKKEALSHYCFSTKSYQNTERGFCHIKKGGFLQFLNQGG